jgi:hypothetical protein
VGSLLRQLSVPPPEAWQERKKRDALRHAPAEASIVARLSGQTQTGSTPSPASGLALLVTEREVEHDPATATRRRRTLNELAAARQRSGNSWCRIRAQFPLNGVAAQGGSKPRNNRKLVTPSQPADGSTAHRGVCPSSVPRAASFCADRGSVELDAGGPSSNARMADLADGGRRPRRGDCRAGGHRFVRGVARGPRARDVERRRTKASGGVTRSITSSGRWLLP